MKKAVLIVLGSPNSASGKLSDISKRRLNYCVSRYQKGKLVLCTGGWGESFNTSHSSHASYAKEYLMNKGFFTKDFLNFALSENTVDDAVKIKSILSELEDISLLIITSDYHLNRVKLIFKEILAKYDMQFVGVESNLEKEPYAILMEHEEKAIKSIEEKGLYY